MTETQKRIKAYQNALPHMKERVMAVALLLVVSISMMTSATFAWMTLSRNPEVSSIATTVTTNGNLEIALSDKDGLQPDDTAVGDGGQDVTKSNLTWGNLINLSDKSYGLSDITLRPASLNTRSLATSPMYAVQYGSDGRVSGYLNDFAYTNYVVNEETGGMAFVPENEIKYGVRAISTVTYGDISGDAQIIRKMEELDAALRDAQQSFEKIYNTETGETAKKYMSTVGGLVGIHVDYTLNGGTPDCSTYIENLYYLSQDFLACTQEIGNIIVETANLCLFVKDRDAYNTDPYTFADILDGTLTSESLSEKCGTTIELTCLDYFKTLWQKIAGSDNEIIEYSSISSYNAKYGACEIISAKWREYEQKVLNGQSATVPYDDLMRKAINQMCDMDSATIRAGSGKDYTPAGLVQLKNDKNVGELMPFVGDGPFYATIHEGAIKDVDQLLGCGMYVESSEDIRITATVSAAGMSLPIDMKPNIATSLDPEPILTTDITTGKTVASGGSSYKGDAIAAETYAMVMDFWVRTNSANSLLILEGELVYDQKTVTDQSGQAVGLLYSYTTTTNDENGVETTTTHYVYSADQTTYYSVDDVDNADREAVSVDRSTLKAVYEDKPSDYQGENRVWDELEDPAYTDSLYIPESSIIATQGSGSCYIFYPQSPEDQEQSLKLLGAMRVAFVDEEGTLLARAAMDTGNAVESSGRVIVPLQLRANTPITIDSDGTTESYYIAPLTQNEAKRITAIVYLDGTNLSNSDVLAAGSITGQLNIQFGSTDMTLNPVNDGDVMKEHYEIDFTVVDDATDTYLEGVTDTAGNTVWTFAEGSAEWKLDLSLTLGGAKPSSVKANFISVINATQGARQPEFTMTYDEKAGTWNATVEFTGPGNYQLRSIRIDGVDYALDGEDIIYVKVPGMSVTSLIWGDGVSENSMSKLTADSQYQQDLILTLGGGENAEVQGVFIGDNGQNVTVNFTSSDGVVYRGTGTFSTSGHYELTYVYIDDVITALPESMYKELDLKLGLRTVVGYTAPKIADGTVDENILKVTTLTENNCTFIYNSTKALEMDVWCKVYDDQGSELTDLGTLELYYPYTTNNALDADMTWNEENDRYEGTFEIEKKNGIYNFGYLALSDGNTITTATKSPVITSIPPDPMAYVGQVTGHQNVIFDLGATERKISLVLKNAAAATLNITLESPKDGPVTVTGVTSTETNDQGNVFTVDVSKISGLTQYDGTWTIVGAEASTVFYDGTFYDGSAEEGATGWLDLTPFIEANDPISTYFLTTASVAAKNTPNSTNTGTFMADHEYNNMTISVVDSYGNNLADTMAELGVENPTVSVYFTYEWIEDSYTNYAIGTDGALPDYDFGGNLTANDSGVFPVGDMNFMLQGNYQPTLKVTIAGTEYSDSSSELTVSTELKSSTLVSVTWETPDVIIKSVSAATNKKDSSAFNSNVTNAKTSNYSCTVYCICTWRNAYVRQWISGVTLSKVTLELLSGYGDVFENATITVPKNTNNNSTAKTFVFKSNALSQSATIGDKIDTTGYASAYPQGNHTISTIVMAYDGVSYTLSLKNSITINNPS